MPGLEIRYLAFNTNDPVGEEQGRAARPWRRSSTAGHRAQGVRLHRPSRSTRSSPASITGAHQLLLQQVRRARAAEGRGDRCSKAGVTTPVKLKLHYTTDHYGAGHRPRSSRRSRSSSTPASSSTSSIEGTDVGRSSARAEAAATTPSTAWAGSPTSRTRTTTSAPFLDKDNFLNSPYVTTMIAGHPHPAVPAGGRPQRRVQDLHADPGHRRQRRPVLPLWQGKQYVACARPAAHRRGVGASRLLGRPAALGARGAAPS